VDPLPEPDVLLEGGEVLTFGETTVEYVPFCNDHSDASTLPDTAREALFTT